MTFLKLLALYYAYNVAVYIYAAAGYLLGSQRIIAWGAKQFPVISARGESVKKQAMRLMQVVAVITPIGWALWRYPLIGALAALGISGYEIWLSWTHYRTAIGEAGNLRRLTFHALLAGALALSVVL